MMRVRISENALQDVNEGFLFYEAQELGSVTTLPPVRGPTSKGCEYPPASPEFLIGTTTAC
jgi:hypothetical protein